MSSSAPIVFINRGNSSHLFRACAQARRSNPHREIILLGDCSTAHYRWIPRIRHVSFYPYLQGAKRLEASFQNYSTNGREFELLCLQRWFILHEFLIERGKEARCIHLDSDILVYDNLDVPEADFASHAMTFQGCSAHSSFINSTGVLGEFVQFILAHYEDPAHIRTLKDRIESLRQRNLYSNVSDMTFLLMFQEQHPEKMIGLTFPEKKSYALDQTIDSDVGGFEMENGIKNIIWQNGLPYCRHLPTGKLVQFYTLHFQGKSKRLMENYSQSQTVRVRLGYEANQVFLFITRCVTCFLRRFRKNLPPVRLNPARWLMTLRQFSVVEAFGLIFSRMWVASPIGKVGDNFVAADTFSFVFQAHGNSTRLGNTNLIVLPCYRGRENVRMLLRRNTTDFHIFNQVFRSEEYKPVLALLEEMDLSASIRIIDAGSNVGCSPIWWLCCFPNSQVVAIEPDSGNFHHVEENVRLNGATQSIRPLRRAVWSSSEKLSINQDFRDGREYAFSVRPVTGIESPNIVDGITIPEILTLQGWSGVDILKVDIEGAERFLFEEFRDAEVNLRGVSLLALEIHDEVASREKIELNLRQLGFQLHHQHETVFAWRRADRK